MIVALLEAIVFVFVIASTSLLCGLLRTAKTASQATEEQQLAALSPTRDGEHSTTQSPDELRTAA
jgi:hypothetical protein